MGQSCAYVKSADMNIEYFVPVGKITALLKMEENGKNVFHMFVLGDQLSIPITETDYNDLIQMMKAWHD